MIAFATLVDDGHVFHRSKDGEPLERQPNATFAHRADWFEFCTVCAQLLSEVAA